MAQKLIEDEDDDDEAIMDEPDEMPPLPPDALERVNGAKKQ